MNYPQVINGANVFIDGFGHLGTTKTVTLPKFSRKTFESSAGGVTREFMTGMLEKLEFEMVLSEYSPIVYTALAVEGLIDTTAIIKANIKQNGVDKALVAVVKGSIKEIDDGDLETEKEVERKVIMAPNFYSLMIDGTQGIVIDAANMIVMVNGVDILETMRSNLQ